MFLLLKEWEKPPFSDTSFSNASFISGPNSQGSLSDIELHNDANKKGFLAFFRLLGTVYLRNMHDTHSPLLKGHTVNTNSGLKMCVKTLLTELHSTVA